MAGEFPWSALTGMYVEILMDIYNAKTSVLLSIMYIHTYAYIR